MILRATLRRTGWTLLGHEDHAEAAFADLLEELVGADLRPGPFADRGNRRAARTSSAVASRKPCSSS